MPELRKRKAPSEATAPSPPVKKANSVKSTSSKNGESAADGPTKATKVAIGNTINLEDFGGEIETNDGEKVTLKKLVEDSENGVVLFTYPKASTSTCTTQAKMFRDEFEPLSATGFAIYGLSTDSPTANTNFKSKQKLPYTLLCDPKATLIAAIGLKKPPSSTTRGVFVVDKKGNVKAASPGNPAATVEVVRQLVGAEGSAVNKEVAMAAQGQTIDETVEEGKTNGDQAKADVAAEVADSAMELDGGSMASGNQQPTATVATNGNKAKAEVAAEVADSAQKLDGGV
ncbi:thioredoxin-dependent peroxiredoxin, partial [Lecanoromycetidae sp. Uapishka_2]